MDHQRHDSQPILTRILVAADSGVDPHRLVTLCCERMDSEFVSHAAGVRLEDFVLADEDAGALDVSWDRVSSTRW